ncbi:MAG: hypothetical protein B5M51_02035 [Anaerolinea sp. 4484_236]|nr:MAG: hypothetical protein B5M51_02035 [Anaerolinea sp. 4484_236]
MNQKPYLPKTLYWLFVILIFLGGLWIRLIDLDDLPLDFHPTRQLFSALKARGIYYQTAPNIPDWQREMAIQQWKRQATIEPEIVEHLAVFAYRRAGEANLVFPRLFSIAFWMIGGIFIFLAAKRLVSPDGALLSLSFYLFLPYGVYASRSFQPDPLMVMLIAAFIWALAAWQDERGWRWAILTGLFGGMAILVKMVAIFFVAGGAAMVVLRAESLKRAVKNAQIWVIAILSLLPTALYFAYGILLNGFLTEQFGGRFFPALLLSPSFYLRWGLKLDAVIGYLGITFAILGLLSFPKKKNGVLVGLWGGYILYGLYFNYHFSTHDYYQLPFILVAALSLAPLGEMLASRVSKGFFSRFIFTTAWTLALLGAAWTAYTQLRAIDYRPQAQTYREIGNTLRDEGRVVALSKDYGYRLNYWGWLDTVHFPSAGDIWYQEKRGKTQDFTEIFTSHVQGRDFFLVTDLEEWENFPELQEHLFAHYPLLAKGENYLIFDLRQ